MVPVAIWLTVQQSYGLGVEAVQEPFGPRLGAPGNACSAIAERTVYDLGGWSPWQYLGPSSDTAWYRGPGWQGAWPQWCTGLYALPSVAPYGRMPSSCHNKRWCSQSRCSQWCSCSTWWWSEGPWQIFSALWGGRGTVVPSSWLCWCVCAMIGP